MSVIIANQSNSLVFGLWQPKNPEYESISSLVSCEMAIAPIECITAMLVTAQGFGILDLSDEPDDIRFHIGAPVIYGFTAGPEPEMVIITIPDICIRDDSGFIHPVTMAYPDGVVEPTDHEFYFNFHFLFGMTRKTGYDRILSDEPVIIPNAISL